MGARGTKPTPTAILAARGSWRSKIRHGEPKPQIGNPKCPAHLSSGAKKVFKGLVKLLAGLNVLTVIDSEPLGCLAQAIHEHAAATEALDRDGRFLTNDKGQIVGHPALLAQRAAWATIGRMSAVFGLDPANRSRLKVENVKDEDPVALLLRKTS